MLPRFSCADHHVQKNAAGVAVCVHDVVLQWLIDLVLSSSGNAA